MKKILLVTFFLLQVVLAFSQSWTQGQYTQSKGVIADSAFRPPVLNDTAWKGGNKDSIGAIIYRKSDDKHYAKKPWGWEAIGSVTRALDSLRYDPDTGKFFARLTTGGEIEVPTGLLDSIRSLTLQRVTELGDTTNHGITIKNRATDGITIQQHSADSRVRWIDSTGVLKGAVGDVGASNNFEIAAYSTPLAVTSASPSPIQFRVNGTLVANMDDTLTTFNTEVAGVDPTKSNHLANKNYVDTAMSIRIWQYPMSTLVSQPAIQIQPTHTIPQIAGELQAQINAFTGKYIETNPSAMQNNVAANFSGSMYFNALTTVNHLLKFNRPDNINYDMVFSFWTAGIMNGYLGLPSRNNNDFGIYMPNSRIKFQTHDTSGVLFITMPNSSTAKVSTVFKAGKWLYGDSLAVTATPAYPLQMLNTPDTTAYFLHKAVMDVNLPVSDSGRILAPTDWVKKQAYLKQSNANLQTILSTGNTATTPMVINSSTVSAWAATITGQGSGASHGLYVNVGASSTGTIFRADKNGTSKMQVTNAGATQLGGSLYLPIAAISANTTLDDTHYTVRATASGITITLPSAGAAFTNGAGKVYVIMNDNTGGSITISSFRNNGAAVTTIANNTKVVLQSDGTNWYQTN